MESKAPKVEDHCKIQVLVKPVDGLSAPLFNRILERLNKANAIEVCASPRRVVLTRFVPSISAEHVKFGEFQAFRKVFGLICLGQNTSDHHSIAPSSSSSPDLANAIEETVSNGISQTVQPQTITHSTGNPSPNLRRSSLQQTTSLRLDNSKLDGNSLAGQRVPSGTSESLSKQLTQIKESYRRAKVELGEMMVDSRCVLFGFSEVASSFESPEFVNFQTPLKESAVEVGSFEQIEEVVRELVRSIYFVLESRRLDTSFERMENPPFPTLPEEEKYRMGVEHPKSKTYRKKCLGRLRKRVADHALLTGLPEAAIQSYQSAIDLLKAAQDLLWLAAAYEGWCCAAMVIKYKNRLNLNNESGDDSPPAGASIPRVPTISDPMDTYNSQHDIKASIGHQRYHSDEGARIIDTIEKSYSQWPNAGGSEASSETEPDPDAGGSSRSTDESPSLARKNSNRENNAGTQKTKMFGGGVGTAVRKKPWSKLLTFDSRRSDKTKEAARKEPVDNPGGYLSLPSSQIVPANRSSSMHNLKALSGAASTLANGSLKTENISTTENKVTRNEITERFKFALEHYERFSFVAHVEYECVMRAISILVFHRQFIEVEAFLREHNGKYLDDKFFTFDNTMKADICMATAEIYNEIGFSRKNAFFLRLAVLFRLHVDDNALRTETDYKQVYPVLHQSLRGYGIGSVEEELSLPHEIRTSRRRRGVPLEKRPFAIQIKAIHEVFTCAVRAGYHQIAIRHLCYILQTYFDRLDKAVAVSMIEELNKLVKLSRQSHSISEPIVLETAQFVNTPKIILPSLQFSRFPTISDFQICPLPPHLAPNVIAPPSPNSKIFIYSPFQDRDKGKKETYWVVDCSSEVSVSVKNPLPVELEVKNLILLTEGCQFEAVPVRLTLPSCYGSVIDPSSGEIKLIGVPRSIGRLTFTGYACEVLGVRNVYKFPTNIATDGDKRSTCYNVQILEAQPLLQLEVSLNRIPTLSESRNDAIAEAMVFSGQSVEHSITLSNTSQKIGIKKVVVKIQQPEVCGGPKLLQLLGEVEKDGEDKMTVVNSGTNTENLDVLDLKPTEKRVLRFRIFGIDPTTAAASSAGTSRTDRSGNGGQKLVPIGEEQKIFVRRPTSTNLTTMMTTAPTSKPLRHQLEPPGHRRTPSMPSSFSASVSTPLLASEDHVEEESSAGHDLIPYTGRLLSAEFSLTYTSDVVTPKGEQYERSARLPLAITIVPAVNVSDWHILAGDNPTNRYVVVDVQNQTNSEAELTYGQDSRVIWVAAKEVCRVPLLCPCCTEIQSGAFHSAAQRASHMMQMQEIERLRRKLEQHVARHLEIRWNIPHLGLEGVVPVGSLLSSVSFLKQLVIPTVSISLKVNGTTYMNEDDVAVGIGEMVSINVCVLSSLNVEGASISGELSLSCYQELQNGLPNLARPDHMIVCGAYEVPFLIENPSSGEAHRGMGGEFVAEFNVMFRYEGVHKVRPQFTGLTTKGCGGIVVSDDDVFVPAISFSVVTKFL